jgi:hypothetical protein
MCSILPRAVSSSALRIVENGIIEGNFGYESDFGPAFYCAESLRLTMLSSIYNMSSNDDVDASSRVTLPIPSKQLHASAIPDFVECIQLDAANSNVYCNCGG